MPDLLQPRQHFEAVDVRHHQVEHEQIDLLALDRRQRFGAVANRHHAMAVTRQRRRQHAAQVVIIFGHENRRAAAPGERQADLAQQAIVPFALRDTDTSIGSRVSRLRIGRARHDDDRDVGEAVLLPQAIDEAQPSMPGIIKSTVITSGRAVRAI